MAEDKTSKSGGQAQPSGPAGGSPSTAGKDETGVRSFTPENRQHSIDPSSPNTAITSPSTQAIESDKNSNDPE